MVSLIGRKASRSDAERGATDEEQKDETAQMEQEEEDEDAEMRLSTGDDDEDDDEDEDNDEVQANDDEDHHQPQANGPNGAQQRRQHRRARHQKEQAPNGARVSPFAPPPPPPLSAASPECGDLDEPDEEQLKRILAGKRLSEGNCNRHLANHLANICRKNSLHLIGESLPPVTEGEPMRHMSHHMSQSIEGGASSHSNSTSSSSLRGGNVRHLAAGNKRNSQDENMATSCSSSTSLDGSSAALRSPTRRRSSTVSQCSSVLSEGTRQQLNFDLSPDLPPDSSILEANAISPTDYDRPASPEPSSLDSMGDFDGSSSFDMRPVSRLSDNWAQFNSEEPSLMAMTVTELDRSACSPDEPKKGLRTESVGHLLTVAQQMATVEPNSDMTTTATITTNDDSEKELRAGARQDDRKRCATSCGEVASLEQIITNVSEVKVSSDGAQTRRSSHELGQQPNGDHLADSAAGTKRAHTPFGANIQRNKATHIESGPN